MPSPFHKPVGALRSRLLAELSNVEESSQVVEDLIVSAQADLASLIHEKYRILREIEERKADLSPVNYVPFEVLGTIFTHVVRRDPPHTCTSKFVGGCPHDLFNNRAESQEPNVTSGTILSRLQLVCRRWRNTINSYPSLWGELHLVGPFTHPDVESYKRLVDRHIIRSRASSLHICLVSSHLRTTKSSWEDDNATRKLLSYLSIFADERWKSFSLCWHELSRHDDATRATLSNILSRATRLEHLVLHHNVEAPGGPFVPLQSPAVGLRYLRSLALIDMAWSRFVFASPAQSIQHLTICLDDGCDWASLMYTRACGVKESVEDHTFLSVYKCVHWLSLFPALRSLHLMSHLWKNEWVSPFHPHRLNARGINGRQPPAGSTYAMANDLYDRIHSPPLYEARLLDRVVIEGSIPAWILHGILFPSLRTLQIVSNRLGVSIWEKGRQYPESVWDWRDVDLSATTKLILDCGGSSFDPHQRPFWCIESQSQAPLQRYSGRKETSDEIVETFLQNSRNQAFIRDTFDAVPNVKTVTAPSCVWRAIKDAFYLPNMDDALDSLISYAAYGGWNPGEDLTSEEDLSHLYRDYEDLEQEPMRRQITCSEEWEPCLGPFELPGDVVRAVLGSSTPK
ncbi:hypothetical protein FRC17_000544 [Serendipita sp. 399]|nr:hypothetical protein FRC17_000544 [Serendipita sp. 399]